jgi:phosphomannomutase
MTNASDVLALARDWLAHDPDPNTRTELEELLRKNDVAELTDRFGTWLEFGTAGLRGTLGTGTNRMNRAVVRRTTLGLARYLKSQLSDDATRSVVVGRDGRHMSPEFLEDVVGVLTAEGFVAHVYEGVIPTPMVSHGVNALGAAAGVMVTASHNPPAYNGYKVYWGNGAQIIPPTDAGIAASIAQVGPADGIRMLTRAEAGALYRPMPASVEENYLARLMKLQLHAEVPRTLSIAYTPMHGVGNRLARTAFARAGFTQVETVAEQAEPDGDFPTVKFPNPEEPGAMDRVIALAEKMKADVAIANDPDADRLAVAARDVSGKIRVFTGNEVGLLLGHYVLTEGQADAKTLVVTTVVSSSQLGAMARELGVRYAETLTGFKWITNRAMELEKQEGLRFAMGFEEALGYTVGTVTRDKDGVSSALVVADLANWCKQQGRTLVDELGRIQKRFGLFSSAQKSITLPGSDGAQKIAGIMTRFRDQPPAEIGGHRVRARIDIQNSVRFTADGKSEPLSLPKSNVLVFELEGDARVVLRPSGTEPKIKFYFERREAVGASETPESVRIRADQATSELQRSFLRLIES